MSLRVGWVCLTVLSLCASGDSQQLKISSPSEPVYVGNPVTLQVEAINFDTEPTIEIKGAGQPGVSHRYVRSGSSQSTQIYQAGGKMVRSTVIKTTFYYQVEFAKPGEFEIGPFEAKSGGKTYSRPKIKYVVKDVGVSREMEVAVEISPGNKYPGQRVPVKIVWKYAGELERIRGLTIRSPLFSEFQFVDSPAGRGQSRLPVSTPGGVQEFPAKFERKEINGKLMTVVTVQRMMVTQSPGKTLPLPVYATFQKVTGYRRSDDLFSFSFERQPVTVPMKAVGQPVEIEVSDFPPNAAATFSGAIGSDFRISASLNRTSVQVGDPLTLQVNIDGSGNVGAISLPQLDTMFSKQDFDWPKGDVSGVTNGNQKQFKISLRIKRETVREIPPLVFSWFDPEKEKYFTAKSEPIAVEVKKGQLVSSNDVVRNMDSLAMNQPKSVPTEAAMVDFSIEKDVNKLLREEKANGWLTWIIYASGLFVIVVAVIDRYRRRVPSETRVRKSRVDALCSEIEALQPGEHFMSNLAINLRELQGMLAADEKPDSRASEIDRLVGKCDTLLFRPVPASLQEQQEMYDLAKEIVKRN